MGAGDLETRVRKVARPAALLNALEHAGRANPGAVMGRIMADAPELREHAREIPAIVQAVVADVNDLGVDAQRAELEATAPELLEPQEAPPSETGAAALPDLLGATDDVVLRFAPNPNGPLTLGHSRGLALLAAYRDRYDGTLVLRYDDTDPVVKAPLPEGYAMIAEDFRWLAGDPDRVVRASEALPRYYEVAESVVRAGNAYVCRCSAETFRELKREGTACPHRGQDPETNLDGWRAMLDGALAPGDAVLRVKTDMAHPDPALRDWVAFRIVPIEAHPHPVTGTSFRVWPLLDFQSAVEDHDQGVTHIVRGKDLMDSTRKQGFLYDHLGWTYPETLYWGRVKLHEFGRFSTSELRKGIEAGTYTGWDDPRLPTLAAFRRRGFQPEALRAFWLDLGLTEKDIAASAKTLAAENRKVVDPAANRYFLVRDPVPLDIATEEPLRGHAPLHPDHPDRGERTHLLEPRDGRVRVQVEARDVEALAPGARLRLKDLGNVELLEGGRGRYLGDDLAILEDGVPIVHWVPDGSPRARLLLPDGATATGFVERQVLDEAPGDVVQFERVGFARLDAVEPREVQAVFAHR